MNTSRPPAEARAAPSLDVPPEAFEQLLGRCAQRIVAHYERGATAPCHTTVDDRTIRRWFDEPLPEQGMPFDVLLDQIEQQVMQATTLNTGTRMFAYVMSGGTQVSVAADMLASALDQNVAKWHLAPSMTEIEKRVIVWAGQFIGLDYEPAGAIVSSGSAANLTGLTVARNQFAADYGVREKGLFGMPPLVVYASEQTHSSVQKSVEMLGLGSDNLRRVATVGDHTVDIDALRQAVTEDLAGGKTPFCIVANAGTVNTGAIDPLHALADLAAEFGMWLHVDGAYGGLAASQDYLREHYAGLSRANSIALDFHKWLYQPFEIGCTLVRDWATLERSYHHSAAYLEFGKAETRLDISRHHFDLSRNAKFFKVWASFKAYGAQRLREMIGKDIDNSKYLARQLDAHPRFELVTEAQLAIVCFRWLPASGDDEASITAFNEQLLAALEHDGRIFITGTILEGRHLLRACAINHRMGPADIDYLVSVIEDVARQLELCEPANEAR